MTRYPKLLLALTLVLAAHAQEPPAPVTPSPDRRQGEGEGPFDRMVIRGITMIDGTGAPPRGPVDIVVEGNRIREVKSVGVPGSPIDEKGRPAKGSREIDGAGMYILPGFVDLHVHTGGAPKAPEAEYVHKMWVAPGVTAGRGVPFAALHWLPPERERGAEDHIGAARPFVYQQTL